MIPEIIAGVLVASGIVSGWIAAWRSRGEALDAKDVANNAAERARIAEVKASAAEARTLDMDARRVEADTQAKVSRVRSDSLEASCRRLTSERGDLLEKLAKLGAPVGDDLFDDSMRRLYAHRDGQDTPGNGTDPGVGGGQVGLPADPSVAPTGPGKG